MMTRLRLSVALVVLVLLGTPWADAAAQRTAAEVATTRQRAEQGDAAAQDNLGLMYNRGDGVPQDDAQAVAWFRKAADQGYAPAQARVGLRSRFGLGVPQDYTEAIGWYRKAADQGHSYAQYSLGVMYGSGQGVPQDYVESHKWVNLAAARATGDNQQQFAERRDALRKVMTAAQVAEAQQRASEWQAAFDARQ